MRKTTRVLALALMAALLMGSVSAQAAELKPEAQEVQIQLSDEGITVDGVPAADEGDVYVSRDIVYYEQRETYDSGNPYGEGEEKDRHSAQEAAQHTVVHIGKAGVYRISGKLSYGQIAVDLGKDAKTDPRAVVTLILDNADITCTVAPAIIFYRVYECDQAFVAADEDDSLEYSPSPTQDTSAAGANIVLSDGSVNHIQGSYVARIYKDNEKKKKLHKYDGAVYSKMSMNIDGDTGVLNIEAENEGLDTELHLTVNGGLIRIRSGNDGINTNEDGVSVTTVNGGDIRIVAGLDTEGDGIDSNGYLVINGGSVIAMGNPRSDSGLDSDEGTYIHGGWVLATGSTMDWAERDSKQATMNLQFAQAKGGDQAIVVTDTEGKTVFAYDPKADETVEKTVRSYQGAVLSCPGLEDGGDYKVYVGGSLQGQGLDGLYDTVTDYTGGTEQQYSSTNLRGGPMGGWPFGGEPQGMTPPEGSFPGKMPEGMEPGNRAEAGFPGEMPEGGFPGEMPEGGFPGEMPDWMKDQEPPEGFENSPGIRGEQGAGRDGWRREDSSQNESEPSTVFHMAGSVSNFGGITDAADKIQG